MTSNTNPPQRAFIVTDTCGYADRLCLTPGESIEFKLNSDKSLEVELIRLGNDVDNVDDVQVLETFADIRPGLQPIHPGSYAYIDKQLEQLGDEFTIEFWIRPWKIVSDSTPNWASIISNFDYPDKCGFAIFLDQLGKLLFYAGDGKRFDRERLLEGSDQIELGKWHHVCALYDNGALTLWVDGGTYGFKPGNSREIHTTDVPLRLASAGEHGKSSYFLDADLAYPTIYLQKLGPVTIGDRYASVASGSALPLRYPGVPILARWEFAEERGDRVKDSTDNGYDGRIINHATWGIGGPPFDHNLVEEPSYNPLHDELAGHGLRFCSDDLVDCLWETTILARIPESAESGYYAARIREISGAESGDITYHIPFIVHRAHSHGRNSMERRRNTSADVAIIASTNTWFAYNPPPSMSSLTQLGLGLSFYNKHRNGCPNYYVGLKKPNPNADPYSIFLDNNVRYSHALRAERFVQGWLDENSYSYDVLTDIDLHHRGLIGYKAVIICCHSEYWSLEMRRNLDSYLSQGGNVVCLSGNTMYWRVSLENNVLECRKIVGSGPDPNVADMTKFGSERLHSQDKRPGGLMRNLGFPSFEILGLETYGMITIDKIRTADWKPYRIKKPDHFLFDGLNFKLDDEIGERSLNGPAGCGDEFDITMSSFASVGSRCRLPKDPPGIEILAQVELPRPELSSRSSRATTTHARPSPFFATVFDFDGSPLPMKPIRGADMIYWERPQGGKVFNVGSITFGGCLPIDSRIQQIMKNVLRHFGVEAKKTNS